MNPLGSHLDSNSWITHWAGFDDAVREFPAWTKPETGVIKAIIEF